MLTELQKDKNNLRFSYLAKNFKLFLLVTFTKIYESVTYFRVGDSFMVRQAGTGTVSKSK